MTTPAQGVATLHVLGPVALTRVAGASIPELTQPRPLAVLSYLVLARPRRLHSRETLLALLWPETDQARGRHALRNVLHLLRKVVGDDALVAGGDELVGIAPGSIGCDALQVEELVERKEWEAALSIYQDELLAGFHVNDAPQFEEWLYVERTRFREMMVRAASALAQARHAAGDLTGAIRAAERRVQLAPDEEGGQRQLMQLLAGSGERASAIRVFERLEQRLRTEYGSTPSRETHELLASIRNPAMRVVPVEEAGTRDQGTGNGEATAGSREQDTGNWNEGRGKREGARWLIAGGVAAVIAALAMVAATRDGPVGPPSAATLFVAPMINATGDSNATWLGEGFTISLRDQFRRAGWQLVPESRVKRALRESTSPGAAAQAAGAALLLAGRADSSAGRVRLRLEAIRTGSATSLASAEVLVQPGRLLDAELALVGELIGQLRPELAPDSLLVALRRGTTSEEAYRFYLQGCYLWDRRFTLADMQEAAARFDSALAHDPVYADALAARARTQFAIAWSGYGDMKAGIAAARADARRAVELDSLSRVALSTLGAIETLHDSVLARKLLERAVSLDPDRSDTFYLLGLHYAFRGEYPIAERAFRRAIELEPLSPFPYTRLAAMQVCQGALDQALATMMASRAVTMRPDVRGNMEARQGVVLLELGRWQEAAPLLQSGWRQSSPDLSATLGRARSEADVREALRRDATRKLAAQGSMSGDPRYHAILAARAGRTDEAAAVLISARKSGDLTVATACEEPMMLPVVHRADVAESMRLVQGP